MPRPTTILKIERFPADLHRRVKVQAARAGLTLRDWIIAALAKQMAGQ